MTDGVDGLRWHTLRAGKRRAFWRASKPARAAGFPIISWRLWTGIEPTAQDRERIAEACISLNSEQRDWLRGKRRRTVRPGRRTWRT